MELTSLPTALWNLSAMTADRMTISSQTAKRCLQHRPNNCGCSGQLSIDCSGNGTKGAEISPVGGSATTFRSPRTRLTSYCTYTNPTRKEQWRQNNYLPRYQPTKSETGSSTPFFVAFPILPNNDKIRHGRLVKPADRRHDNQADGDSVVRDLPGTSESEASDASDVVCGVSGVGCVWELRCAANDHSCLYSTRRATRGTYRC
ncbi:hypothetical protein BLNAU_6064 [Blattamonas nauphoetae]|uniref:Uncharacterized protein n=1 Tax=Blattamonas nauphoetae TaxID=2049346 RepID=A0ABQ9Y5R2_9EUKA|nr:hypothetical protein BLNAU_6064 [Blattamonas nauphoetae]